MAAVAVAAAGIAVGVIASAGPAPASSAGAILKLEPISTLGHLRPPGPLGPFGPEVVPIPVAPALASSAGSASGHTVDGIGCDTSEQTLFHIHAHLTVFVDGAARQIPYGIGILHAGAEATARGPFVVTGSCFYWLHTHADDGIIHIESPVRRTYTLGEFFDIWNEPLGPDQVGPVAGRVTALYDGKHYLGDPRDIPLEAHAQIQLDIGRPVVGPVSIRLPGGL